MTRSEEHDLLASMIDATQKQIQKNPKDKLQLAAELNELQNEFHTLQTTTNHKNSGRTER